MLLSNSHFSQLHGGNAEGWKLSTVKTKQEMEKPTLDFRFPPEN
jgi:hypothetical protein